MNYLRHFPNFITTLLLFNSAVEAISDGSQYDHPSPLAARLETASDSPVLKKATLAHVMQDVLARLKNERKKISDCNCTGHAQNDASQINNAVDEIRTLAANIAKEPEKLTNVEERLMSEMKRISDGMDSTIGIIMPELQSIRTELANVEERQRQQSEVSERMDSVIEKIMPEIQNVRTELTNVEERLQSEMSERMDSAVEKTKPEFESVRTELGNLGQKLEATLLMGTREEGNRTIDALRREQNLHESQVPPSPSPPINQQAAPNNIRFLPFFLETEPDSGRSPQRLVYLGSVDGVTYYVEKRTNRTWADAKKLCEGFDIKLKLATVQSRAQYDFLINNLQQPYYWLGAHEFMNEGAFRWEKTKMNPVRYGVFYAYHDVSSRYWCLTLRIMPGTQGFQGERCTNLFPTICQLYA